MRCYTVSMPCHILLRELPMILLTLKPIRLRHTSTLINKQTERRRDGEMDRRTQIDSELIVINSRNILFIGKQYSRLCTRFDKINIPLRSGQKEKKNFNARQSRNRKLFFLFLFERHHGDGQTVLLRAFKNSTYSVM